jgi:glycosyltransferase involved in cell wall biosynthesis
MIGAGNSGVASYAGTLYQSLASQGFEPMLIDDDGPAGRRSRLSKWVSAARPGPRKLFEQAGRLTARDIFREAQVHFTLYGRLLELVPPCVGGLVHWTYPVPLHVRGWKNLYTVHDAIPLQHPELTAIAQQRHRRLLDQMMAHSDRIVTVTESARRDISAATGCPIGRIANLSQAVDVGGGSDAPLPAQIAEGRYFLFAGTIEARKNVARLVEAHGQSGTALPLVVVGVAGWGGEAALARIHQESNVVMLPPQPRAVLLRLIGATRAMLFPSLAEGFGLPIAEAMTLGVPVLTSSGGATEETAGGAACLVDPHDTGAMAQAIARLAQDEEYCARLRAAGLARAEAFRADAYAGRLRALYSEVMNG